MNGIKWDQDNLHTLGRHFLRNVLGNMRGNENTLVRFGETGQGIQPNYQVTFPNGVTRVLRGSSHEAFQQVDEFDSGKISQPFNLATVTEAYRKS